jgi:O-antigen/teichoic acid export membrane protein
MRNIGFMGASTGVRLVFGLLTFAVLARQLGAEDFGRLMTALASAVLAGLIVNYGFANYALREIGASPVAMGRQILAEVLTAKLMLGAGVMLLAVLALPWLPAHWRSLVALMLLAQTFDAVTDLLNVGFRATGRFAEETRVTTIGALLHFTFVGVTVWSTADVHAAAAAYVLGRLMVLGLTWRRQRLHFRGLRPGPWRQALKRLSAARAYAVDNGLQSLFGQVDSLVIAHFFGPAAVGIYQAGMRLFLGGAQAASVLGNVAIPRLAALHAQGQPLSNHANRVQGAFLATGLLGALAMAACPSTWITAVLGADYARLASLLPWFALLFLIRFAASASGVLLTSLGFQARRATWTALHWVVVAAAATWWVPHGDSSAWLQALILGNVVLAVGYTAGLQCCGVLRASPALILGFVVCAAGLAWHAQS